MTRTIWTYGCSVSACSDYRCKTREEVYSKFLANKFNAKHKNYSIGCGSNSRIFRLLFSHILENKISSEDIVIVQYTTPERREFFSRHVFEGDMLRSDYKDGQTLNFKADFYGRSKEEQILFKLYEDNCVSSEFEIEISKGNHAGLLALSQLKKINLIFLSAYKPGFFPSNTIENNIGEEKLNVLNIKDMFQEDKYVQLDRNGKLDRAHFSPAGHKEIADRIYNKILNEGIVVEKK